MTKINVLTAAFAAIATSMLLSTNAMAAAKPPDVSGKKFSEAQAALKAAGYTAVVSTSIGDTLPQSDCLVVREEILPPRQALYEVAQPPGSSTSRVLLSLNCNPAPGKSKPR